MSASAASRSAGAASGWASRKPALLRIVVSGVRNSCDASAVNRCCAAKAAWRRSIMVLTLVVRRPRSSRVDTGGNRRLRSRDRPTSSASAVRSRSGRSARPATSQIAGAPTPNASTAYTSTSTNAVARSACTRRMVCAATT
jgi:hypothetical protein